MISMISERVNTPNILSDDAQKINAPVDKGKYLIKWVDPYL